MGMTLSIGIYTDPAKRFEVYDRLIRRLAPRAKDLTFVIGDSRSKAERYPIQHFNRFLRHNIYDLNEYEYCVEMKCKFEYGKRRPIDFFLRTPIRTEIEHVESFIVARMQLSSLMPASMVRGEVPLTEVRLSQSSADTLELNYVEAFLLEVCGLLSENEEDILHASLYPEHGWPPSEECLMIYHQDVREFAYDIARSYAAYRWGIFPIALFQADDDMLNLSPLQIEELARTEPLSTIAHLLSVKSELHKARFNYSERLTPERIRKIFSLSTEDLHALLLDAASNCDGVHLVDFGARGMIVFSRRERSDAAGNLLSLPWSYSRLWKLYSYIFDAVA